MSERAPVCGVLAGEADRLEPRRWWLTGVMPQPAGLRGRGMFQARPLSPATWGDLEELFGLPGGSIVRGCWCMHYRLTGRASWQPGQARQALCDLVDAGGVPGLVGYLNGSPVGWISLGPRPDYLRLRRSPIMKPVDDTEVWSVVCSYVAKP